MENTTDVPLICLVYIILSFSSLEQINEAHAQFIVALEQLFEKYKERADYADLHLRIQ